MAMPAQKPRLTPSAITALCATLVAIFSAIVVYNWQPSSASKISTLALGTHNAVIPPSISGQAIVPSFDIAPKADPTVFLKYLKQITGTRLPTLADWQILAKSLPKEDLKAFKIPIGEGHFVMALCQDLSGSLWVGTEGEGLWRYDPSQPAESQWTNFTSKDSPPTIGDDFIYALACDLQGRVWAGHLNHGISVFNGQKWQSYEVVAGLSRPGSLNGPLGERIFHITVCNAGISPASPAIFKDPLTGKESPMPGSIWMCTSAGLSIYFPSTDTWSYLTRADGLPSDQANSLAFGQDGTVFVATQCDGITIASPADHYATWKQVKGPDEPSTTPTGSGLPTNLMNKIMVAKNGVIYATTTTGLTWSNDNGSTWQFARGADYADKVKGRYGPSPIDWNPSLRAILSEDYSTALAENAQGDVLIGHRATGGDVFHPKNMDADSAAKTPFITCFLCNATHDSLLLGAYGGGVNITSGSPVISALQSVSISTNVPLPPGQSGTNAEIMLRPPADDSSPLRTPLAFLGEDWTTQGDWVGRYGRQYAQLCASNSPFDDIIPLGMVGTKFSLKATIGPHANAGDSKRNWLTALSTNDPNSPWNPFVGTRREGEWDDHGETYARTWEGPNLIINTTLPEGLYRLSLYFYDGDGHRHANSQTGRDFLLLVGLAPRDGGKFEPLSHIRVEQFNGGCYKQFLLEGDRTYRFEILREYSLNTILNAVFIDRLAGPPGKYDSRPLGAMGTVRYDPPFAPSISTLSEGFQNIVSAWELPRDPRMISETSVRIRRNRILAYRIADGTHAPSDLLGAWRWAIPLWNSVDRRGWTETMKRGWDDYLRVNHRTPQPIIEKNMEK